jgi:hypothetical protein
VAKVGIMERHTADPVPLSTDRLAIPTS